MLFLTRWFGVTRNDAERNLGAEQACIEEIVEKILLMQANAAAKQHWPLGRGTHAKGVAVRAQFEVFDVTIGRDRALAGAAGHGIFTKPGIYPATVRFANSDPTCKFRLQGGRPLAVLLCRPYLRRDGCPRGWR